MGFFLRKIRKAKWYKHPDVLWLGEGELQADALSDLKTEANELSVWFVEADRSNLERVIAALAAEGDHLSNFDYALCAVNDVLSLEIEVTQSPGRSPDQQANEAWHRDLTKLTARALLDLAGVIRSNDERHRVQKKQVEQLVARGVMSGKINREKLKPSVKEHVDRAISTVQ